MSWRCLAQSEHGIARPRLGTHWADFGNVEPNPNRTMPWSGRRLLSTQLLTRAQWQHWSHFDPKRSFRGPWPQFLGRVHSFLREAPGRLAVARIFAILVTRT